MRSSIHGTFATLLLLIPVGAIPALAIFGIPQFAPVVASPLHEGHENDRERREGRSARGPADELFLEEDDLTSRGEEAFGARGNEAGAGRLGDAVAVPERHAARGSSPDNRAYDGRGEDSQDSRGSAFNGLGRVPSWGDDLPVENRQSSPPRGNENFEQFADSRASQSQSGEPQASSVPTSPPHGSAMPFDAGLQPFTRSTKDRATAPPARRPPTNEPGRRTVQPAGNEVTAENPQGFQRQRETPLDRAVAPAQRDMAATAGLTWPIAVQQLNDLEIRNFRLEPGRQPGQFVFICSYTPTDSPRVSYRFEAEADEPLKAVEKVLAQIGEWQQRR